jgi:hypothetical protein
LRPSQISFVKRNRTPFRAPLFSNAALELGSIGAAPTIAESRNDKLNRKFKRGWLTV